MLKYRQHEAVSRRVSLDSSAQLLRLFRRLSVRWRSERIPIDSDTAVEQSRAGRRVEDGEHSGITTPHTTPAGRGQTLFISRSLFAAWRSARDPYAEEMRLSDPEQDVAVDYRLLVGLLVSVNGNATSRNEAASRDRDTASL
jgi:hypothetical protein